MSLEIIEEIYKSANSFLANLLEEKNSGLPSETEFLSNVVNFFFKNSLEGSIEVIERKINVLLMEIGQDRKIFLEKISIISKGDTNFLQSENTIFVDRKNLGILFNFRTVINVLESGLEAQIMVLIIKFLDELPHAVPRNRKKSFKGNIQDVFCEAFQKLPVPIALLSTVGEIILHNLDFSRLNILPKTILEMDNQEEIEIQDESYKVFKDVWVESGFEYTLVAFFTLKNHIESSKLKKASTTELGIITSSMAHELNNPLAGIGALLSIISMDEDLDENSLKILKEMKNCSTRCSALINIFLGFGRVNPQNTSPQKLIHSFESAMDLLSFRMVENNICLLMENNISCPYGFYFNSSIISMIFYLILNEILTSYSQLKLIEPKLENSLKGKYLEELEGFGIIFGKIEFNIQNNVGLTKSKLIKHLLDLENLDIKVSTDAVLFLRKGQSDGFFFPHDSLDEKSGTQPALPIF